MAEYKNYIFDLYGTLVDIHTNEGKASLWKYLAQLFGMMGAVYEPGELKRQYKKLYGEETGRNLLRVRSELGDEKIAAGEIEIHLENVFEKLFEEKNVEIDGKQAWQISLIFRSLSMSSINLYEGVGELFTRLREAGKKIYLLSNAQRMFTEPEMKLLDFYDCFDGIIYSSDEGVKKPSFYFYDAIFKKYELKKEESVMIGNEYIADIFGAHNYGIDSMYVHTAQSGKEPPALPESCRRIAGISDVF
ncbi:MAG: HAD family hydrolase [Clostridium sp.]|nr:HAD family hydrolase [Clostridium sp.]